jgi:hypothetical protein
LASAFTSFDFSSEQAAKACDIVQQMTASFSDNQQSTSPKPFPVLASSPLNIVDSSTSSSSPSSAASHTPRRGRWSIRPSLGASASMTDISSSSRPSLMVATADDTVLAPEEVPIMIARVNDETTDTAFSGLASPAAVITNIAHVTEADPVFIPAVTTTTSTTAAGNPHRRRWSTRPSLGGGAAAASARPSLLADAMLMSPTNDQASPAPATEAPTSASTSSSSTGTDAVVSTQTNESSVSSSTEVNQPEIQPTFSVRSLAVNYLLG